MPPDDSLIRDALIRKSPFSRYGTSIDPAFSRRMKGVRVQNPDGDWITELQPRRPDEALPSDNMPTITPQRGAPDSGGLPPHGSPSSDPGFTKSVTGIRTPEGDMEWHLQSPAKMPDRDPGIVGNVQEFRPPPPQNQANLGMAVDGKAADDEEQARNLALQYSRYVSQ